MSPSLGERIMAWGAGDPAIQLLVLIGSRTREGETLASADAHSDWDFQVATSDPGRFAQGAWLAAIGLNPLAYVLRTGRLGSALKASAVTEMGELDLVVIPVEPLRGLVRLVQSRQQAGNGPAMQALTDLSAVVAGGYRLLKGGEEFSAFYEYVGREIPPARLDDAAVSQAAEAFVCDYVFTCRKIARGELIAAQRWLHQQLVEANFRLRHELRLRQGHPSFPDARRIERLDPAGARALAIPGGAGASDLRGATEQAAENHRRLVAALIGTAWQWPDLSRLGLRAE